MICPYCGTENKAYQKKCKKCKYPINDQYAGTAREKRPIGQILPIIVLILVLATIIALGIFRAVVRAQLMHRMLG